MKPSRKTLLYIFLSIIILIAAYLIVVNWRKILRIFMPFLIAVIISYLLKPLVDRLQSKNISRSASIILIYIAFVFTAGMIIIFVIPELVDNTRELVSTLPNIINWYQAMFDRFMFDLQSSKWSPEIKGAILKEINNTLQAAQGYALNYLKNSLSALINLATMLLDLVLAMIIAYYFLKDGDYFRELALSLTSRKWRTDLITTGREISSVLSSFIQGQLLTALIVGTIEILGLMLIRVKYPIVLGSIGGLANIIPYFGPIIGAVPAVGIALIESPAKAIQTVVVFIVVQQLDNALISPKIIEGRLGLHPVTTILAVLAGGEFFGITGMFFAVPLVAMLKVIFKKLVRLIV